MSAPSCSTDSAFGVPWGDSDLGGLVLGFDSAEAVILDRAGVNKGVEILRAMVTKYAMASEIPSAKSVSTVRTRSSVLRMQ